MLHAVVVDGRSCGQVSIRRPHGAVGAKTGSMGGWPIPAGYDSGLCAGWWQFESVSTAICGHLRYNPSGGVGGCLFVHIDCRDWRHQWRTERGGLGCSQPPSPRNSEDIGGVLDRISKKNRRLDFHLQFTVFSYGCNLLNKGFF